MEDDDDNNERDDYEEEGVDFIEYVNVKEETQQQSQQQQPVISRPGFQVTDNTSYYNLASLYVILYAHVKEGHPMPSLFSIQSTQYGDKPNVKFNFQ